MPKIVVCGYMVRYPLAGNMHAFMSYVAGLCRFGHDVIYIEESGWAGSCYDPRSQSHSDDPAYGLKALSGMMAVYALDGVPYAYVDRASNRVHGTLEVSLEAAFRDADLVVNVGGVCWLDEFDSAARLVLIDMDPLFTQLGRFAMKDLSEYDVLFTYGQNLGRDGCLIPTLGYQWTGILPPVVTELWGGPEGPGKAEAGRPRFTTIANWSAYGEIEFNGRVFGQKNLEFEKVIDLPETAGVRMEIATENMDDDARARFRGRGWTVTEGGQITLTPEVYASFIRGSTGEFSVAKNAYVESRSGWVSDRTACYLAAGRPAVVQDTGAAFRLPAGQGILNFTGTGDAADCIARVLDDYTFHRRRAKEIAADLFDYARVLPGFLDVALA